MGTDLNLSPRTQRFEELTRNMSAAQVERIRSGALLPEEASHDLFRRARQAWLDRQTRS